MSGDTGASLTRVARGWRYGFAAMGSPCELLVAGGDGALAERLGAIVANEARRIEAKYSRYRSDSVISAINTSAGRPVVVDDETAALLDYAAQCHELSGGRFDITSGVLRRLWRFDGSDNVPTRAQVRALLPLMGWQKLRWQRPELTLPTDMEIDFGGLGKEYAVDRALLLAAMTCDVPLLVNFGGDLRVSGPLPDGTRWRVLLDSVDRTGQAEGTLELTTGALTTSGDAQRFLLRNGVRYSHILDPRSGWPVKDPPRSVTVAAPSCMEAGVLSTLAMLHGRNAEKFLKQEQLAAWLVR